MKKALRRWMLICSPLGRQMKKICLSNGEFFMPKKSFSPDIKIMAVRYLEEGLYTGQEICIIGQGFSFFDLPVLW